MEKYTPESKVRMEPLLLRMNEAAKLCSVSRAKLYKMVSEGNIPAVKFGKTLRIPFEGLMRAIESSCQPAIRFGAPATPVNPTPKHRATAEQVSR